MKLIISNIKKDYGNVTVLKGISLEINSGGVYGFIGPNGAGKSTLMKIIATLITPSSGNCLLNGVDIGREPDTMRKVLGYLPQDIAIYPNLTALEFLEYMASLKSINAKNAKRQIETLLEIFNLSQYRNRRLSSYSGGMRQRIGISAALLGDPKILILDEPSVGLDPLERINLRNLLIDIAKKCIVLLSTHIISDIDSTATEFALIHEGQLLFNATPQEFSKNTDGDMERAYIAYISEGVRV